MVMKRQMHDLRRQMTDEVIPDSEDDGTPPPPSDYSPFDGRGRYWRWPLSLPSQADIKVTNHAPLAECMDLFKKLGLSFVEFPDSPWPSHAQTLATSAPVSSSRLIINNIMISGVRFRISVYCTAFVAYKIATIMTEVAIIVGGAAPRIILINTPWYTSTGVAE
ncbi:hypothetical protein DFH09DRAFT_1093912 [Mycena vulgaris]|nr:hypothetical protein DFH09DRAFT_1093912 [Mycena vulgaris]